MRVFCRFLAGFIDIRHGIKARIFLSLLGVTIVITVLISMYWYQRMIQSAAYTITDNMEKNVTASLARLEYSFQDVRQMHLTVIYESNCWNYLVRDSPSAPSHEWFTAYQRLHNNLGLMGITMSRTISGTGVYKTNGATCVKGALGLPFGFSGFRELFPGRIGNEGEVMFFGEKPAGERFSEVLKYVFVGRTILDYGEEKAMIVSKINERVFTDAINDISYPEGFTLVFNRDHNVLFDSNPGRLSGPKTDFIRQFAEKKEAITVKDYIAFYKSSGQSGVTLVSAMPVKYLAEHYREIRFQLIVILLGAVFAEAFLSMLISNQISLGLRILERNMERAGDGSVAALAPVRGDDEVGRLNRTYIRMMGQIQKLMGDIKENEYQKRQMEIRVLRAQISPHFLYNSLNTIGYLARMQNAKNIHTLVTSLIELLRGAVNVDDALVPLSGEILYVENYLTLQQYRFPRQIRADFRLDEGIDQCLVPKMILQPIVENALIHGLNAGQEDPSVTIKAYVLEKNLILSVTDNGVGMTDEAINEIMTKSAGPGEPRFSGIGIGNVHARIRLQFGERYGISIFSRPGLFTTVEIRLPAVKSETGAAP